MDYGSLISSLVGLGTKVAGAVPGLKKPKKVNTAKEVAKSATAQFGNAVGAAQSGHGASRGLALREGLRQGVAAAGEASAKVGMAAQRDVATNQANMDARNERIAAFTGDLAKGLGDMAAAQIGPKDGGGDAEAPAQKSLTPDQAEFASIPGTGVADAPLPEDMSKGLGDLEQDAVDQDRVEYEAEVAAAGEQLDDFRQKREDSGIGDPGGPAAAFQVDPATKLLQSMPPRLAPEIEQHLADRLHMNELALAEAERLGIGLDVAIPRMQRRLQLQPGQSSQNPMGHLKPDYDDTGVE